MEQIKKILKFLTRKMDEGEKMVSFESIKETFPEIKNLNHALQKVIKSNSVKKHGSSKYGRRYFYIPEKSRDPIRRYVLK